MSGPDFDWFRDDGTVVVKEQAALAIYANTRGNIVIRQERTWDQEDDTWIVVTPDNARLLVEAIMALIEPEEAPKLALPAPLTNAERQRRHRERRRNDNRNAPELFEGATID